MHMSYLPRELLLELFSFLSFKDLIVATRVSQIWRNGARFVLQVSFSTSGLIWLQNRGVKFTYSSDFDNNGLLYFLGTNFGRYQNFDLNSVAQQVTVILHSYH